MISNIIYSIGLLITWDHAIKLAVSTPVGIITYNVTSAAIALAAMV